MQNGNNSNKKWVIAFDLDNTLIDSSHRSRYLSDGSYDLDYWRAHATWQYIQKDTLMPLYSLYQGFLAGGFFLIAVTARNLGQDDYRYLQLHNLQFDAILARENSEELDHALKNTRLTSYFDSKKYTLVDGGFIPLMAFDDKQENLDVFDSFGFRTFYAPFINHKAMAGSFADIVNLKPKDCF